MSEGGLPISFVVHFSFHLFLYYPLSNCEYTNNTRAGPGHSLSFPPSVSRSSHAMDSFAFTFPVSAVVSES